MNGSPRMRSLRAYWAISFILIGLSYLAIMLFTSYVILYKVSNEQMQHTADLLADYITIYGYDDIVNYDYYDLQIKLDNAFVHGSLTSLDIYDQSGKCIYHRTKNDGYGTRNKNTISNSSIVVNKPIVRNNNAVGTIQIEFSNSFVRNLVLHYGVFYLVILLTAYIVSFLISSLCVKRITDAIVDFRDCIRNLRSFGQQIIFPRSVNRFKELAMLAMDYKETTGRLFELQEKSKNEANLVAIGQSTAMVAHDVRKPLTGMKALLQTLPAMKDEPEQIKRMIAGVDRSIAQTNELLNDILEFSRDSKTLELADHNPQGIIVASLGDALRNHPHSSISISYRFNHQYTSLRCDRSRIIRVLTNILDNAIGAMTSDDGNNAAGNLFIETLEYKKGQGNLVSIAVEDEGRGIPAEYLDKIYDPFFTFGKKSGTGLGLAICRRIVNLHGGTITAMNNCGKKGARVVIELPAGEGRMSVNESELIHNSKELQIFRVEEARREDYGDTSNLSEFLRINNERGRLSYLLIVDDEPLFRETVRSMLEDIKEVRDHVRVVEVGNAETALKLFEARDFDYVIADLDLGAGCMNGYEFAEIVLKKFADAHLLIHSNRRKGELDKKVREIMSSRFMGFLPKPMHKAEMMQFLACKTFDVKTPAVLEIG